jgi:hypothetical protein
MNWRILVGEISVEEITTNRIDDRGGQSTERAGKLVGPIGYS